MSKWYVFNINSEYYNFKTSKYQRNFTPECITEDFEEASNAKRGNEFCGIYKI